MKVLIFGPSGSGKTYLSGALKEKGINAYDDGDIKGLSGWYDRHGNKIESPATAREALDHHYSFLWSKRVLRKFLESEDDVYVFGGSGNLFDVIDLFDRVYFLKIEPAIQKQRIFHRRKEISSMDLDEEGIVTWGDWLEEEARKRGIPFIDATLSPGEIFEIIRK